MPTYEYRCNVCGHELEQYQPITAEPLRKCPACGRQTLRRLIGAGGGILFKGSGFYQTDYRSDSYKKAAAAEAQAGSNGKNATSAGGGGTDSRGESGSANRDKKPVGKSKTKKAAAV